MLVLYICKVTQSRYNQLSIAELCFDARVGLHVCVDRKINVDDLQRRSGHDCVGDVLQGLSFRPCNVNSFFTILCDSARRQYLRKYSVFALFYFCGQHLVCSKRVTVRFLSRWSRCFHKLQGVTQQTTPLRSPQINGLAERLNCILQDKCRRMLIGVAILAYL